MSKGRPKKNTQLIEINNIRCEFIVTKQDKYSNDISYLKIIDNSFKQKLKPILDQGGEDYRLPLWKTDEGLYLLKVKQAWMPKKEFEQNEVINANLLFKQYCFTTDEDKIAQGYFCKMQTDDGELD